MPEPATHGLKRKRRWALLQQLVIGETPLRAQALVAGAEIESVIDRLGEKKRPLDEVRDFNPVRLRNWTRDNNPGFCHPRRTRLTL
jgi:hypothetical protein